MDGGEVQLLTPEDANHAARFSKDGKQIFGAQIVGKDGVDKRIDVIGVATRLGAGVAQKLTQLYPNDKGTGYTLGQIRGAMTLRQPVAN